MEPNGPKLSVWTEGLDDEWKASPGLSGQVDRGTMEPSEIPNAIERIWAFNGEQVECSLSLQQKSTQLKLTLEFGKILASDPQDMNYQGVEIIPTELISYLEGHFEIRQDVEDTGRNPVRLVEWCVLGTFLLILGFSILYMNRFLNTDSGFLPLPEAVEFDGDAGQNYLQKYSGIYTTGIKEGGMLIELKQDGSFGYYDLSKAGPTLFRTVGVNTGNYQPVLIRGKVALLTDNRFVFTPTAKEELEFLQRKFNKLGKNRDDVPYLKFPE